MQQISMLFQDKKSAIGEIVFDAAISECHNFAAKATTHPIEDGSSISDHVHTEPVTIQIDGIITNTPTSFLNELGGENLVLKAFERVGSLFEEQKLVDVVTSHKTYKNMALESVSVRHDAQSSDALRLSCTAKQIKTTKSANIRIARPKVRRVQPKQNRGKQSLFEAKPAEAKRAKSVLASIFGGA